MLADVSIMPLTPDCLPDLADLFEEGGDPKWCWCAYFRVRGIDFSHGAKSRHRAVLEAATHDGVAAGHAPGLVAYEGDVAVGWISVGPRDDYERLAHSRVLAPVDGTPVWSIVCFVVGTARPRPRDRQAPARRRHRLCAGPRRHRDRGLSGRDPEGQRVPPGDVFRGTLRCSSGPGSPSSPGGNGMPPLPYGRSCGSTSARPARPGVAVTG